MAAADRIGPKAELDAAIRRLSTSCRSLEPIMLERAIIRRGRKPPRRKHLERLLLRYTVRKAFWRYLAVRAIWRDFLWFQPWSPRLYFLLALIFFLPQRRPIRFLMSRR